MTDLRAASAIIATTFGTLSIFLFIAGYIAFTNDDSLESKIRASGKVISNREYWKRNSGTVSSMDGVYSFTSNELADFEPEKVQKRSGYVYYWYTKNGGEVASTLGSDRHHHFVQGYLSLYKPFEADQLWIPHYVIAMRKRYEYDEAQYNGFVEIWQNSMEAYANARGDCEDHSMILCDWLNALGYEARVVAGSYNTNGHAWVVLYLDGDAFILEATQKSNLGQHVHYPLAAILPEYLPEFMFDHDYYYTPITPGETSHDHNKWQRASRLTRNIAL